MPLLPPIPKDWISPLCGLVGAACMALYARLSTVRDKTREESRKSNEKTIEEQSSVAVAKIHAAKDAADTEAQFRDDMREDNRELRKYIKELGEDIKALNDRLDAATRRYEECESAKVEREKANRLLQEELAALRRERTAQGGPRVGLIPGQED